MKCLDRTAMGTATLTGATLAMGLTLGGAAHGADCADAASCFQAGQQHYGEEKYQESYEAFAKAYALKKSYDIAANLGIVEDKLGKFCAAHEHLSYAQAHLPPSLDAEKRATAQRRMDERLRELRKRIGRVRLALSPAEATVTVDGKPSTPDADLCFLGGKHQVHAELVGHQDLDHTLDITPGTTETLRMSLVPAGRAATQPDNAETAGPSLPLIIAGLVIGAGTAAGGGALLGVAAGKGSDREALTANQPIDFCSGTSPAASCAEIASLSEDEKTLQGAGIGLLAGGVAIMAATAAYAFWPRDAPEDGDAAPAAVTVLPALQPGYAGVLIDARF